MEVFPVVDLHAPVQETHDHLQHDFFVQYNTSDLFNFFKLVGWIEKFLFFVSLRSKKNFIVQDEKFDTKKSEKMGTFFKLEHSKRNQMDPVSLYFASKLNIF